MINLFNKTFQSNIFTNNIRINDPTQKENLGIIVQYHVKIKLIVSMGGYVDKKFYDFF